MTHNPQPLHLDEEFSKGTEFGQRIVNSLFTLGLVIGVSVDDTTLGATFGNLGMNGAVPKSGLSWRYAAFRHPGERDA